MNRTGRGFTLIELVAIIVLLSVGSVAILGLFDQTGKSIATNQETQTGAQLAQECAEKIIAIRRNSGYAAIVTGNGTGVCGTGFAAIGGFATAPTVNVTAHSSGSLSACPSATAGDCKQVDIQVDKAGVRAASLTLMLVNYP
jgi:Tfp pilus assembly protein PilV